MWIELTMTVDRRMSVPSLQMLHLTSQAHRKSLPSLKQFQMLKIRHKGVKFNQRKVLNMVHLPCRRPNQRPRTWDPPHSRRPCSSSAGGPHSWVSTSQTRSRQCLFAWWRWAGCRPTSRPHHHSGQWRWVGFGSWQNMRYQISKNNLKWMNKWVNVHRASSTWQCTSAYTWQCIH